ncbi:DUF86 domain-containing protein [Virgibacillus sp. NKC19-16]|uniref:DUF86 domain-containing protein n=1 Tax=Virgibacillus salidurans TaxID=2831673 RepID=UPI001F44CECF|nr:DUF86 domain-containing protein [Virgibacillus sp. NKC19-16]UJL45187.1 DUF86 domain-containing protein [Virgibacillus sp. NKC19-16]
MYFVDRSKIEQTVLYMDEIIQELDRYKYESFLEKLSLERMVHVLIESTLDAGNMMIDGFIMRDPGGYEDIIDILIDEKVLPQNEEKTYKEMIRLRKMIVNDYASIDHDKLKETVIGNKDIFANFSTHIRKYLDNELGVANAFSNESL